jgi:hypothetical protein
VVGAEGFRDRNQADVRGVPAGAPRSGVDGQSCRGIEVCDGLGRLRDRLTVLR